MFKLLIILVSMILLNSCSLLIHSKKGDFEQCIIKMREADIAPLKALKICEKIHNIDKDLAEEDALTKDN